MAAGEGATEVLQGRSEMFAEALVASLELDAEVSASDMVKITDALSYAFRTGFLAAGDTPARPLVDPQRRARVARVAIGGGTGELGRGRKKVK